MRFSSILIAIFLIVLSFIPSQITNAEGDFSIQPVVYQFGENIKFQTSLATNESIATAQIFFDEKSIPKTTIRLAEVQPVDNGNYLIEYILDLQKQPVRAFSKVDYHFEVELKNGQLLKSPVAEFYYVDNRFDWQDRVEAPFTVHWYEGDMVTAQKAIDAARSALQRIESIIPVDEKNPIDIYIYSSSADLQDTLQQSGLNWVAGHADPDLGTVMVSLPPGPDQFLLIEQRIPHEIMHIMLYRSVGDGYANLPVWLNEGLASFMESIPNPDYEVLLDSAYRDKKLVPFTLLCKSFPREASGALLAYAQSESFVSFLKNSFGSDKLLSLIKQYAVGVDCEHGVQNVYGASLDQLDRQWRQERFRQDATREAILKLLPWLVLLVAVLIAPLIILIILWRRRPNQMDQNPSAGR